MWIALGAARASDLLQRVGRRDGSGVDLQFMCGFFLKTKTRKNHIF